MIAKSCFDRIPINLCLNRSIFNALLNHNSEDYYFDLGMMKYIDSEVHNSFKYILDNDPEPLEMYFTANITAEKEVDLLPGGSEMLVTNENKN